MDVVAATVVLLLAGTPPHPTGGAVFRGCLSDRYGTPLPGVALELPGLNADGTSGPGTFTDEQGRFSVPLPDPSIHHLLVRFQHGKYFRVLPLDAVVDASAPASFVLGVAPPFSYLPPPREIPRYIPRRFP